MARPSSHGRLRKLCDHDRMRTPTPPPPARRRRPAGLAALAAALVLVGCAAPPGSGTPSPGGAVTASGGASASPSASATSAVGTPTASASPAGTPSQTGTPSPSVTPSPSGKATASAACPASTGQSLRVAPGSGKTVALTFDDGPGPQTLAVADALAKQGVHATFFATGQHAQASPDIVAELARRGHLLAGHSWDHRYPKVVRGGWTTAFVADQVTRTAGLLRDTTGQPACFFRPPGGFLDGVPTAARQTAVTVVMWSVDSLDWQQPDSTTQDATATIVANATRAGTQSTRSCSSTTPRPAPSRTPRCHPTGRTPSRRSPRWSSGTARAATGSSAWTDSLDRASAAQFGPEPRGGGGHRGVARGGDLLRRQRAVGRAEAQRERQRLLARRAPGAPR